MSLNDEFLRRQEVHRQAAQAEGLAVDLSAGAYLGSIQNTTRRSSISERLSRIEKQLESILSRL